MRATRTDASREASGRLGVVGTRRRDALGGRADAA